jgi:hypothetical protein
MATFTAQDIVTAVKQDSQNQTTNSTALLDYTDRVHQRILRESQWRFLLSDPQTFMTMPGVSMYNLTQDAGPPGAFTTNLQLDDFNNIAPATVFDASNWSPLNEDGESVTIGSPLLNRDGSLRFGPPRTYSLVNSYPGTIALKPVPDNQNIYLPVPETPYVTFAPLTGCTLGNRTYYGVVTYVDNFGGESTQSIIPFVIQVPAGNVITVSSPLPVPGGDISGAQGVYGFWNLYVGTSLNNYLIQNPVPLSIGGTWTENIAGIFSGSLTLPSTISIPTTTYLGVNSTGLLTTLFNAGAIPPFRYALLDSMGGWWELTSQSPTYQVNTTAITPGTSGVHIFSQIYLQGGGTWWALTVLDDGQLMTAVASPPTPTTQFGPPQTSTITPLLGYVIQFRYYQLRNQITSLGDVLQVPYNYKDIVIAGVNYLANMYIDQRTGGTLSPRTIEWKRTFEEGLLQIRRDLRINYRKTDFIAPDRASQYVMSNQQGIPTMGW